jgi:ribose transport system permease protein
MAMTLEQTIAKHEHTRWTRLLNSQTFWVFVAIVVACLYLSYATSAFATPQNLFNITRNFTFTAIIALGMTFVIITGGIDLSVGSVLVFCSMVVAVIMHAGLPIYVGIGAALATGLIVGAFNGILIAYLGFPSFVVTLGMLSMGRSFAMITSNNQTVFQFGPDHDKLLWVGGGQLIPGIANPVVYTLILAAITGFVLRWTKFGRHVFAIGGNEHAATLSGIPVRPIKVAVYMICSLTAAIAAIVMTGWLGAVTTNLGTGMELQVIAAAVIGGASLVGGAGTALGALVGAALIEIIRNSLGLLGINSNWQGTFIGLAIIAAVAFERVRQWRRPD